MNSDRRICLPEFPRRRKEIFRVRDHVRPFDAFSLVPHGGRRRISGRPGWKQFGKFGRVTVSKSFARFGRTRKSAERRESAANRSEIWRPTSKRNINFRSGSSVSLRRRYLSALLFTPDRGTGASCNCEFSREYFIPAARVVAVLRSKDIWEICYCIFTSIGEKTCFRDCFPQKKLTLGAPSSPTSILSIVVKDSQTWKNMFTTFFDSYMHLLILRAPSCATMKL